MSEDYKKIALEAGDTLTVGDLTDDYLGAFIEVETLVDITYRFTLGAFGDDWHSQKTLWTPKVRVGSFYPNTQVKVITPPPVVQPDEPTALGQCIRIEGDDDFRGVVVDPGSAVPIVIDQSSWCSWASLLSRAGSRQIIVSDPPRWPDETPEPPERIGFGAWPDDDTHLREWEWEGGIQSHPLKWNKEREQWECVRCRTTFGNLKHGQWTRGNRVEVKTGPKAGDVFTRIEDMPYGWVAKAVDDDGFYYGHVVREAPSNGGTHRWDAKCYYGLIKTTQWASYGNLSPSGSMCQSYTLVEAENDHNSRVAQDNY